MGDKCVHITVKFLRYGILDLPKFLDDFISHFHIPQADTLTRLQKVNP